MKRGQRGADPDKLSFIHVVPVIRRQLRTYKHYSPIGRGKLL
jgi:hypothetical protein